MPHEVQDRDVSASVRDQRSSKLGGDHVHFEEAKNRAGTHDDSWLFGCPGLTWLDADSGEVRIAGLRSPTPYMVFCLYLQAKKSQ